MSDAGLHVGLSAWIIQDGNYQDFRCGSTSRFALEFYSGEGLTKLRRTPEKPQLTQLNDARYAASGIVCFCTPKVWVIDFGAVMAFCEERPPRGMVPGVAVAGELYLGVDPFFYFEGLSKIPGIPPLIYEWRIDEIWMETAPFVESYKPGMGRVWIRDATKLKRVPLSRTDAWNDDGGCGDYVLICRRASSAAFRDINETNDR